MLMRAGLILRLMAKIDSAFSSFLNSTINSPGASLITNTRIFYFPKGESAERSAYFYIASIGLTTPVIYSYILSCGLPTCAIYSYMVPCVLATPTIYSYMVSCGLATPTIYSYMVSCGLPTPTIYSYMVPCGSSIAAIYFYTGKMENSTSKQYKTKINKLN